MDMFWGCVDLARFDLGECGSDTNCQLNGKGVCLCQLNGEEHRPRVDNQCSRLPERAVLRTAPRSPVVPAQLLLVPSNNLLSSLAGAGKYNMYVTVFMYVPLPLSRPRPLPLPLHPSPFPFPFPLNLPLKPKALRGSIVLGIHLGSIGGPLGVRSHRPPTPPNHIQIMVAYFMYLAKK